MLDAKGECRTAQRHPLSPAPWSAPHSRLRFQLCFASVWGRGIVFGILYNSIVKSDGEGVGVARRLGSW